MPSQANKAFITVCDKTYNKKSIASAVVWHAKRTKGFAVTSSCTYRGQGVQNYIDNYMDKSKNYMDKSKNPTPALCTTLMHGAF